MTSDERQRYVRPAGFDPAFNRFVGWLAKRGVSLVGSRVLAVRGRTSGEWRTVPVNPVTVDGTRYLVSPRGHSQWVRNMRVAGGGELRLGRRVETFTATELADADKPPILRTYLAKWGWEVGRFVDGVTKDSSDADLLDAAPGLPVFRID